MNIIIKYIKSFINKYIVSEDPNDEYINEGYIKTTKYISKSKDTPKKKRGRPKKKK